VNDPRRKLPSVGVLLDSEVVRPLLAASPRTVVTDAIRDAIAAARLGTAPVPGGDAEWGEAVRSALAHREERSLRPVYNATGVVLHTNLARAPLADVAIEAIARTAAGYSNLEYDLEAGERGSREVHCVSLLRELTGAEDALVVNNCAAALVLALNTAASGREAIVSRGELIEIGGAFRIPDIMERSGARLREVGTTNRTHLRDYAAAVTAETGALVKVHRSNFTVEGFTAEVSAAELVPLAREHGVPLLHDLGGGLLMQLDSLGLHGEPTVAEAVAAGADAVLVSGDKLLGGPQAGIVAGRREFVRAMARNPLARALRVDKLTLAALEATLALHRSSEHALAGVPVLAMLGASAESVRIRAERICSELRVIGQSATVVATEAGVGGGAFPGARIASFAAALEGDAANIERRLRSASTPVIGRIVDGRLLIDPRTVRERDDMHFVEVLREALA
jgi:L-seryl-tRNA(Ser) seleniumtransferase